MAVALILSGGTGERLGADIPKQYIEIYGRPVISFCLELLAGHDGIDSIQIVAAAQWRAYIRKSIEKYDRKDKFRGFSNPGKNRQLSIYNGIEDIRKYADDSGVVLIHDAARPLLSGKLVKECLAAMAGHDGVLPVLPMKDTIYRSMNGKKVDMLLERSEVYAGQAPEAFRIGAYYEANKNLFPDRIYTINGSTEPAVLSDMDVVMIPGDEANFKITTAEDLDRFSEIMTKRKNGETGII